MSVRETGEVHQVRIATESVGDPSPDLCDLHRVRQPRARCVTVARADNLGLVGQAPQSRGVLDTRPISREVRTMLRRCDLRTRQPRSLRRLDDTTFEVVFGVGAASVGGVSCHGLYCPAV